ncbi:hypothetical protein F511_29827 [Dorcoceras hygrometricum]|uniref:Uncharacterized protein n=1 Tax=Dorcoceras hygrometricum TaxID=472368 RepID=A0A2Z7BHR8_9LAMI|nr:hypothetical protein F511_29827 [Dorcoceras hygrometricum]
MGPGPTVHPHHRDFIATPIVDQIGPIDSVSKTEYYDLKNYFSEPQCKMTVLPLNSGKSRFDPCRLLGSRTSQNPLLMPNTLSSVSVRESRIQYLCDPQWFRNTARRGPTTIVAPKSQFRTCPTDHDSIGYPRMSASGESSTTMHRLLHASGSHPIPPPNDPNTTKTSDLSSRQMVTTWKVRTRVVR